MRPEPHVWMPEGIWDLFRKSADLKMEKFELGDTPRRQIVHLLYCDGLVDTKRINEFAC